MWKLPPDCSVVYVVARGGGDLELLLLGLLARLSWWYWYRVVTRWSHILGFRDGWVPNYSHECPDSHPSSGSACPGPGTDEDGITGGTCTPHYPSRTVGELSGSSPGLTGEMKKGA